MECSRIFVSPFLGDGSNGKKVSSWKKSLPVPWNPRFRISVKFFRAFSGRQTRSSLDVSVRISLLCLVEREKRIPERRLNFQTSFTIPHDSLSVPSAHSGTRNRARKVSIESISLFYCGEIQHFYTKKFLFIIIQKRTKVELFLWALLLNENEMSNDCSLFIVHYIKYLRG